MIKVNEYVRTTNKGIKKIDHIDNNKTVNKYLYYIGEDFEGKEYGYIKTTEIVKHSPNIIDLIEEGDYVNGKEILEIKQNAESGLRYLMYSYVPMKYYVERRDEIKSIVTKQQFEQVRYIVEE